METSDCDFLSELYDLSEEIPSDDEDGSAGTTDWVSAGNTPISITIDGVDKRLLETARAEVPLVVNNIRHKIYGSKQHTMDKIKPSLLLNCWMDSMILALMKNHINNNLGGDPVSNSDITAFIRVELMLSFYKVSPQLYFDIDFRHQFPTAGIGMSFKRYTTILNALSHSPYEYNSETCAAGIWKIPMAHNKDIAGALELFRKTSSHVAYIPGVTSVSLDDDLLQLRSQQVINAGYSQIKNPSKGLGVIHHGVVSICTSLYCGGHVAARKESTIDCVKILLRSLSGASVESQIALQKSKFYWDRGYGGTNGEANQFVIESGGNLVGTAKRMTSFYYTFDQVPGPKHVLIQEKGTMASYWAYKKYGNQANLTKQYALAHRNGLGRVALLQTIVKELGTGKYTYITKSGHDTPSLKQTNEYLTEFEDLHVHQLTEGQCTPEWFLLRKFCITGTGAYSILKLLAQQETDTEGDLAELCTYLSIEIGEDPQDVTPYDDTEYTLAILSNKSLAELKTICRSKKLPQSGTKMQLSERILGSKPETVTQLPGYLELLINSWFMAPFKSRACREGSINEHSILLHISTFMEKEDKDLNIEKIQEYGLLNSKDHELLAFSPDAIAVAHVPSTNERKLMLVEMKTKCSTSTEQAEKDIAQKLGRYLSINIDECTPIDFENAVPEASFCCQLLHGMTCGNLSDAIYVVASLTKIICVVHIQASRNIRDLYHSLVTEVIYDHLGWVSTGICPAFSFKPGDHAVDQHSVQFTLSLWTAVNNEIKVRKYPLPACKHLVPELVAEWNRGKGAIDNYSRFLKNVKAHHSSLSPVGAIWLRLLMTMIYNSYQSFVLCKTKQFLLSEECRSFKMYQMERSKQLSFRQFCSLLAHDLTVKVGSLDVDGESDTDKSTAAAQAIPDGAVQVAYNKCKSYFQKPDLISKRKNKHLGHQPKPSSSQLSCIWCCRCTQFHEQGILHSRHGRKTKWKCSTCDVALCKVKRYGDKSCFELFHESDTLFNPCSNNHTDVHVRKHANRPPVPKRGRKLDSDTESISEDVQTKRRKTSRIITVPPRRSRRQNNNEHSTSS